VKIAVKGGLNGQKSLHLSVKTRFNYNDPLKLSRN